MTENEGNSILSNGGCSGGGLCVSVCGSCGKGPYLTIFLIYFLMFNNISRCGKLLGKQIIYQLEFDTSRCKICIVIFNCNTICLLYQRPDYVSDQGNKQMCQTR